MSEYITIPLSKTGKHAGKYEAIVSSEDADLALLSWQFNVDDTRIYVMRHAIIDGNRTHQSLHRIVLERKIDRKLKENEIIAHMNNNGLDNRRSNLRLATQVKNMQNRKLNQNSTSGYKGVSWYKNISKWGARITINKKTKFLGTFDTPEEAHKAYCEAATNLFGEFANFGGE